MSAGSPAETWNNPRVSVNMGDPADDDFVLPMSIPGSIRMIGRAAGAERKAHFHSSDINDCPGVGRTSSMVLSTEARLTLRIDSVPAATPIPRFIAGTKLDSAT